MKLLAEINEELDFLTEATEDGKKNYYLRGIFLQGDIKNRNGRIYPIDVLEKEVNRYTKESINTKRSYGELNHPQNPSINLDKVSHIITELKRDGSNYIGTAKILSNTPNGKIVQALMDEGCSLGVSSRGLGALKEQKGAKVVMDLRLTTAADIVSDPSAPQAFVENVVENTEWFFNGVDWVKQETAFNLVEEYKQKKREEREEQFLSLFKKLFQG